MKAKRFHVNLIIYSVLILMSAVFVFPVLLVPA